MLGISYSGIVLGVCLVLLLICAISESTRYRVKFLIFMILTSAGSALPIPIMLFRIRSWKNGLIPAFFVKQAGKLIGVNYEIRGTENIPKDSGCVVMINHQSTLDLCVLSELWLITKNCLVIAKREILLFGPFGLAAWLWGTIFINRSKSEEAHKALNGTIQRIKEEKATLLIFPEGKRHSGSSLMTFKKGGFHVAIDAQVPILPVVVSKYFFLNDRTKRFDTGTSYITFLPAISTQGLTKEDMAKLIDKTYDIMNRKFVESTQESLRKHMERLKSE